VTENPVLRVTRARANYDEAYATLISEIREVIAEGAPVTDVALAADWSRQYVTDIRDGKAGDAPPRRRTTDRRTTGMRDE
jgi:hypothetical protein